jgi:hypothetical protein
MIGNPSDSASRFAQEILALCVMVQHDEVRSHVVKDKRKEGQRAEDAETSW